MFERDDPARVRFAISPLWETLAAVRVVLEPRRSTFHLPWLDAVRADLARLDPWPLQVLSPRSGWTPDFLTPPPSGPESGIADQLAAVRATPPELVEREVRRSLTDRAGQPVPETAWRLLDDPAATRDLLAGNLEECWRLLIEAHWPRLHDLLHADMQYRTQMLGDYGLERVLADLDPQVRWTGRALVIDGPGSARHRLAGSGLLLMPSAFIWPDVVAIVDPCEPCRQSCIRPGASPSYGSRPTPGTSTRSDGCWAGPGQRCWIRWPSQRPRTRWPSRHGLAPSTASEHLAVLYEAGLVSRRRHRHTILYHQTSLGTELASGGQAGFLTRRRRAGQAGPAAGD